MAAFLTAGSNCVYCDTSEDYTLRCIADYSEDYTLRCIADFIDISGPRSVYSVQLVGAIWFPQQVI